jgi:hypothetical protein
MEKINSYIFDSTPAIADNIRELRDKINELIDEMEKLKQPQPYSIDKDPLKCIKCNGSGICWLEEGEYMSRTQYKRGDGVEGVTCDRCNGTGLR